ncbi:hypothetical protein NECAME_07101 [Necator americanus]|uniref:Uncharacterized protein n=1 Tax=Necator americanus TaxID=51031 RepID=W2TPJ5_NECAM|nr:hypothetical protein NECAME_07101 [Necator americanus]ETN84005.1 hypothetical protein NECAME_07101 [Necator americanus]
MTMLSDPQDCNRAIWSALAKYKDQYSEWKTAHEHYLRGSTERNFCASARHVTFFVHYGVVNF